MTLRLSRRSRGSAAAQLSIGVTRSPALPPASLTSKCRRHHNIARTSTVIKATSPVLLMLEPPTQLTYVHISLTGSLGMILAFLRRPQLGQRRYFHPPSLSTPCGLTKSFQTEISDTWPHSTQRYAKVRACPLTSRNKLPRTMIPYTIMLNTLRLADKITAPKITTATNAAIWRIFFLR